MELEGYTVPYRMLLKLLLVALAQILSGQGPSRVQVPTPGCPSRHPISKPHTSTASVPIVL